MKLLLVAATKMEMPIGEQNNINADVLYTGVGVGAAMFHLSRQFACNEYDAAIQVGICGRFHNNFSLGEIVLIIEDSFAEGIIENKVYKTLVDTQYREKNDFPYENSRLINHHPMMDGDIFKIARGITVSEVTDDAEKNKLIQHTFNADIETMEGAAFHYACLWHHIPFIQIRAVSNDVGERDKMKWKMKTAIGNLNAALITVQKMIKQ